MTPRGAMPLEWIDVTPASPGGGRFRAVWPPVLEKCTKITNPLAQDEKMLYNDAAWIVSGLFSAPVSDPAGSVYCIHFKGL